MKVKDTLLISCILILISGNLFSQTKAELKEKIEYWKEYSSDLEEKYIKLKRSLDSLQMAVLPLIANLDSCQNSNKIFSIVQRKISERNYTAALNHLERLIKKYPGTYEAEFASKKIREINDMQDELSKNQAEVRNMKNLDVSYDEFREHTTYRDLRGKSYYWGAKEGNCRSRLDLRFSIRDGFTSPSIPLFTIGYNDDSWLFVESMIFLIDGKKHQINTSFERDAAGSGVYEWTTLHLYSTEVKTLILALVNAHEVKIRFIGSKYYQDVKIRSDQLESLKHIYKLYIEKGGKL